MTAKEQAIELVDKMYATSGEDYSITFYQAIDCALICVDEIQQAIRYLDDQDSEFFWLEVKEEIQKL